MSDSRHASLATRSSYLRGARTGVALALCLATASHSTAPQSTGLVAEVARAVERRPFAPRVTGWEAYQPCVQRSTPGETLLRSICGPKRPYASRRLRNVAAKAAGQGRAGLDPDAIQALAQLDLLFVDSAKPTLNRAITSLQAAARLSPRPAYALADLSAAYLVRAERAQNARDVWEAAEAADSALALEPRLAAAAYNLALALDALSLTEDALASWRAYLALDKSSGWADEARRRVRVLERRPPPRARPTLPAGSSSLRKFARTDPQAARLWGWDELLNDWGVALLQGDSGRAQARLAAAESLGAALEDYGGDATLAGAVRAIRANASDGTNSRTLASGHTAYGKARHAYAAGDYASAAGWLARVPDRAMSVSAPLAGWTAVYRAATLAYAGKLPLAEERVREELRITARRQWPGLHGTASHVLSTTLLRLGRYQQARQAALDAVRLFSVAGEREHAAAARYVTSDAEFALGASAAGYASSLRALAQLSGNPMSVWRYNVITLSALSCTSQGLHRTGLRLQNAALRQARRIGNPVYVAEAHLLRAQLLHAVHRDQDAADDLLAGEQLIPRMAGEPARNWSTAGLQMARATIAARTDPGRALPALDSVIRFNQRIGLTLNLLAALVSRADARMTLGNRSGAVEDLDYATQMLVAQRAAVDNLPLRASLLDQARSVFDRLVMLQLTEGDTVGALVRLERGRASLGRGGGDQGPAAGAPGWVPPGNALVDYALIGDTLLIWTISKARTRLLRQTVRAADLLTTAERVRSSLAMGVGETAIVQDLSALYDWLIRPARAHLGPDETLLTIIADGEIASVPFEALYDARRGEYLLQAFPLRFASTLRDVQWSRGAPPVPKKSRALLVSDPLFASGEFPMLQRLASAQAEVAFISGFYPHREVVAGAAATRERVRGGIRGAATIHFAGHAVFDDELPEQSYLVLASSGHPGSSRLTASQIEEMDLHSVQLIVLSACETLRSRAGHSGGFAGLSGSLLSAGAGGVVGSLWRVDDDQTRALMIEFHRGYGSSGDAPGALRQAQLALMRGRDARMRFPAAWAGFRYTGQ